MTISVVMTSYNYAQYISEAIESVISQSYQDWELIIVDDGSTDNSVDVINGYCKMDSRIKLYQHKNGENRGLPESLKLGVEKASGDWIAFLESDDKFTENALEEKVAAIKSNPEIDLIFTSLKMFGEESRIKELQEYFCLREKEVVKLDSSKFITDFKKAIYKLNIIPTFSVVMLKKEILNACDFNPICRESLDYYLWAQVSSANIYYLDKELTFWRLHKKSYLNRVKHTGCARFKFSVQIYYLTIRDKNLILRFLLLLNYIRVRLIYLKINKHCIKLNLLSGRFILEYTY